MERLAELRESQALTLRDLAERSGVDANTINQVELGHRKPRPSTLRKLAKALDVEVRELVEQPVPLGEAPREAGPPRVSKERLEEHFSNIQPTEVDYLDGMIADFWRLALPDEKPRAHFVPEGIDTERVWEFLNFVITTPGLFAPKEVERINRGARKMALAAGDKDS